MFLSMAHALPTPHRGTTWPTAAGGSPSLEQAIHTQTSWPDAEGSPSGQTTHPPAASHQKTAWPTAAAASEGVSTSEPADHQQKNMTAEDSSEKNAPEDLKLEWREGFDEAPMTEDMIMMQDMYESVKERDPELDGSTRVIKCSEARAEWVPQAEREEIKRLCQEKYGTATSQPPEITNSAAEADSETTPSGKPSNETIISSSQDLSSENNVAVGEDSHERQKRGVSGSAPLCPWGYEDDIDYSRRPHTIKRAVCKEQECGRCVEMGGTFRPFTYPVMVLIKDQNTNVEVPQFINVPVTCICLIPYA